MPAFIIWWEGGGGGEGVGEWGVGRFSQRSQNSRRIRGIKELLLSIEVILIASCNK